MRIARVQTPGLVHHLIWRCLNRDWLIHDDEQRSRYLYWLGRALADSDWKCIAYAVMSNHIHLAAIAGEEPLASWSRRAHAPFAIWMNQSTGRLGPFFADRPSDYALGPIAATSTVAYIHNNPVRARLVAHARDSSWTSHRAYLRLAPVPAWLHVDEGLDRCGVQSLDDFEHYVEGHPIPPDRPRLRPVSTALARHGQVNTGTPTDGAIPLMIRPFARLRPDPGRLVAHVASVVGLDASAIASRRRSPQLRAARILVAHSARLLGLTGGDVASVLGISRQAVSLMTRYAQPPVEACISVCKLVAGEILGGRNLSELD